VDAADSIGSTGGRKRKRTYAELEEQLAYAEARAKAAEARAKAAEEREKNTQRKLINVMKIIQRVKDRNAALRRALIRAKTDRLTHTWAICNGVITRLYNVRAALLGKKKAVEEMWVRRTGALKRRKGGIGGLEYTLTELIHAYREHQSEGLGSRATLAKRRSMDAHARAKEVRVMVPDTAKCKKGLEGFVNPFSIPCEQVRRQFQMAVNLATFKQIPDTAAKATSINPSADGKAFGVHHTVGCAIDFLTMTEVEKDAFGQPHYEPSRLSVCLPLQEAPNKIASDVLDSEGNLHTLVTPLLFGVMSTLANADEVMVSEGAKVTSALDGAADNRGQGNLQIAMDAMCSEGSIMHASTVRRTVWADAREKIHSVDLYEPLKRFYKASGPNALRGLILRLRARRKLLRKAQELADRPRLREKADAVLAAKEAAILAHNAQQEADRLASEVLQQTKTGAEQSTLTDLQKATADARNTAADASIVARETKRHVQQLKRRRAKGVPGTEQPTGASISAADAAANGAAPARAPVGVAAAAADYAPAAAGSGPDAAAPADNLGAAPVLAAPVTAGDAAATAAAGDGATADNAADVAPVPHGDSAAAAADDALAADGSAPDAAARDDNLDAVSEYAQLPAALRPREPPIRLDVSGAVLKCPKAMERLNDRRGYEKLLRRVLKFERFLRWFIRLWYSTAQGATLIKEQLLALRNRVGLTACGEDSTGPATEAGPGSVRKKSKALDLDLMMQGLTDQDRASWKARIEQLFGFETKDGDGKKEFIIWKKLEFDQRFGDRKEQAMALVRRARIKRCDDWGRSLYGSEWRLAGAELVESWEACKRCAAVGAHPDHGPDVCMPLAREAGAPADADHLSMQDDNAGAEAALQRPVHLPFRHHQVGSQLTQVRLTWARNIWPSLRRRVGLADWIQHKDSRVREEIWCERIKNLAGTDHGSVVNDSLLLANEFRSMFWSARPMSRLRERQQGVSMDANPARFWGCYDQRLQDREGEPIRNESGRPIIQETGNAVQCISHKHHNSSRRMMPMLDREFPDRIVSLVTYLHDSNVKQNVLHYAKHFVFPNVAVDQKTSIYSLMRKIVDQEALPKNPGDKPKGFSMGQIRDSVGPSDGISPPATSATVRWATVCKSGASLAGMPADILAVGVARKGGYGKTPEDEARALASIFSERGFVSEEHKDWVISKKAEPFLKSLVDPRSKSQMSMVRFLSKVVVSPLLAIASERNFCSRHMQGMGSTLGRCCEFCLTSYG